MLQRARISSAPGFIAALDQSGGSTPHALALYGLDDIRGDSDDMYRLVHAMRTRIITSKGFAGDRIIGAILFEDTVMNRRVKGLPTATHLWEEKNVVPFLKIDRGLETERDGVQLMKQVPDLSKLLAKCGRDTISMPTPTSEGSPSAAEAMATGDTHTEPIVDTTTDGESGPGDCIFGTKARSVIRHANASGIKAIVAQQFAVAAQVLAAGLVPIVEPEVDIHAEDKAEAEGMLQCELGFYLGALAPGQLVGLRLTLPEDPSAWMRGLFLLIQMCTRAGPYLTARIVEAPTRLQPIKPTPVYSSTSLDQQRS